MKRLNQVANINFSNIFVAYNRRYFASVLRLKELIKDGALSAVIDFGGMAIGDPASDLVIAWTFLKGKSREMFIESMAYDLDTWLRARGWALWKATFELCQTKDKNNSYSLKQKQIIKDVL